MIAQDCTVPCILGHHVRVIDVEGDWMCDVSVLMSVDVGVMKVNDSQIG